MNESDRYVLISSGVYGNEAIDQQLNDLYTDTNNNLIKKLIEGDRYCRLADYRQAYYSFRDAYSQDTTNPLSNAKMIQIIHLFRCPFEKEEDYLDPNDFGMIRKTRYYQSIINLTDPLSLKIKMTIANSEHDIEAYGVYFRSFSAGNGIDPRIIKYYESVHEYMKQNYAKSLALLKELRDEPFFGPTENNAAMLRWIMGDKNEAIRYLYHGLTRDPNNYRMHFNMAEFCMIKDEKMDSIEEVITHFKFCFDRGFVTKELCVLYSSFIEKFMKDLAPSNQQDLVEQTAKRFLTLMKKANDHSSVYTNPISEIDHPIESSYVESLVNAFLLSKKIDMRSFWNLLEFLKENKIDHEEIGRLFPRDRLETSMDYLAHLCAHRLYSTQEDRGVSLYRAMNLCQTHDKELFLEYFNYNTQEIKSQKKIRIPIDPSVGGRELTFIGKTVLDYSRLPNDSFSNAYVGSLIFYYDLYGSDRYTIEDITKNIFLEIDPVLKSKNESDALLLRQKVIEYLVLVYDGLVEKGKVCEADELIRSLIERKDLSFRSIILIYDALVNHREWDIAYDFVSTKESAFLDHSEQVAFLKILYERKHYRKCIYCGEGYLLQNNMNHRQEIEEIIHIAKIACNYETTMANGNQGLVDFLKNTTAYESQIIGEQIKLGRRLKKEVNRPKDFYFHNLQRWNSYTPIIDTEKEYGGGAYFRLGQIGFVLDPGFNFLRNFFSFDYNFSEIDVIFISHAHNDHSADLESILTLLHKYNANIDEIASRNIDIDMTENHAFNPRNFSIDGFRDHQNTFSYTDHLKELEKQKRYSIETYRKKILLLMSSSTLKKYSGILSLRKSDNYRVVILESHQPIELDVLMKEYKITKKKSFESIYLVPFANKHDDVISNYSSFGFVLHYGNTCFVYTGDTGYVQSYQNLDNMSRLQTKQRIENSIEENIAMILAGFERAAIHVPKIDSKTVATSVSSNKHPYSNLVFLCNLGGIKKYETEFSNSFSDNVYPNHLGRIGVFRLVERFQPDLCLLSEFGMEFMNHRESLCTAFEEYLPETRFIPCDINLVVKFLPYSILVKTDKNVSSEDKYGKFIDYRQVTAIRVADNQTPKNYQLYYVST